MPHIDRARHFDVEPERLWAVVADPHRFGEWLTMHRSWASELPAEFSAGTQVTAVVAVLNIPATVTWTVERYDAPLAVRLRGVGLAGIEVAIALDLAPDADGSALTVSADFDGALVGGALGPLIENAGQAELDRSLERLGAVLAAE